MTGNMEMVKKRLESEKVDLGSYQAVAEKYDVNVKYIWEWLVEGRAPSSREVCNRLGIITPGLEKTRKRREMLDRIARSWGYDSWCNFETDTIRFWREQNGHIESKG